MSLSAKALERLLDKTEFELVARTRRGKLTGEKDADLRDLARSLRERRDKARDVARRQRREFRGKVAPQGAQAASDNSGTKAKADALTVALKRVGAERTRREEKLHAPSQRSLARKALALKQRQLMHYGECANCGYPVESDYVLCPNCHQRLKNLCGHCGHALEPAWTVCPYCASPVSGQRQAVRRAPQPQAAPRQQRPQRPARPEE